MFELLFDWKIHNLLHKYTQRVLLSEKVLFFTFPHISFAVLLNEYCSYTNILKYYNSTLLGLGKKNVTRVLSKTER